MKTKIKLGKPISESVPNLIWGSVYRPVSDLVYDSVESSVWESVSSSVWTSINNSMIWEIKL